MAQPPAASGLENLPPMRARAQVLTSRPPRPTGAPRALFGDNSVDTAAQLATLAIETTPGSDDAAPVLPVDFAKLAARCNPGPPDYFTYSNPSVMGCTPLPDHPPSAARSSYQTHSRMQSLPESADSAVFAVIDPNEVLRIRLHGQLLREECSSIRLYFTSRCSWEDLILFFSIVDYETKEDDFAVRDRFFAALHGLSFQGTEGSPIKLGVSFIRTLEKATALKTLNLVNAQAFSAELASEFEESVQAAKGCGVDVCQY